MNPSTDTPQTPEPRPEAFPPGLHNIFIFNIFNSLSFQIVLGSPMVLYAKTLDASATILGIIAGMMPLLVIFQIPAAKYLGKVGYKRFVFAGWGTRTMFIVGMAIVPLTSGFLSMPARVILILILLFCFNLARGITSCAWLPWISTLVPASLRGPYVIRDMACQNFGGFMVFVISAFCLGGHPDNLRFALLFAFSAAMGGISLNFLRQVPESQVPAEIKSSSTPVPWKEIASFPPFRKLLKLSVSWAIAYGGINTFVVAFLKTETTMTERDIMLVMSTTFIGGLGSLYFLGARLDRLGSKPVMTFAILAWVVIGVGWGLMAGGVLFPSLYSILGLLLAVGLFSSLFTMSQTRLALAVVPKMGRDHFFALFSVITNVTLGLSPILWGVVIDCLKHVHGTWHGLEFNRFSLFFLMVTVCFLFAIIQARRLQEPDAVTLEELIKDIFRQNPLRALRLWKN